MQITQLSADTDSHVVDEHHRLVRFAATKDKARASIASTLNLSNVSLVSLEGLNQFSMLQELHLDHCGLQSLSGLPKMEFLQFLSLNGNQLRSLGGLEVIKSLRLRVLEAECNSLSDVSDLRTLYSLETVLLGRNSLVSTSWLEELLISGRSSLRLIRLSHNPIGPRLDFSAILQSNVTDLYVSDCGLLQLTCESHVTRPVLSLCTLSISDNPDLTTDSFKIEALRHARVSIDIRGTKCTNEGLKAMFPLCFSIRSGPSVSEDLSETTNQSMKTAAEASQMAFATCLSYFAH